MPHRPLGRISEKATAGGTKADQVPDPCGSKPGFQHKKQDCTKDGAFKRSDPAHQNHKDHVGRPLNREICLGLKGRGAGQPKRTCQSDAERRENKEEPFGFLDIDADRTGCIFIVANGADGSAGFCPQQDEQRR